MSSINVCMYSLDDGLGLVEYLTEMSRRGPLTATTVAYFEALAAMLAEKHGYDSDVEEAEVIVFKLTEDAIVGLTKVKGRATTDILTDVAWPKTLLWEANSADGTLGFYKTITKYPTPFKMIYNR